MQPNLCWFNFKPAVFTSEDKCNCWVFPPTGWLEFTKWYLIFNFEFIPKNADLKILPGRTRERLQRHSCNHGGKFQTCRKILTKNDGRRSCEIVGVRVPSSQVEDPIALSAPGQEGKPHSQLWFHSLMLLTQWHHEEVMWTCHQWCAATLWFKNKTLWFEGYLT